jgi:hypothetical protein
MRGALCVLPEGIGQATPPSSSSSPRDAAST